MDPRSLLTDDMRAAVGREVRRLVSFPIGANDIRRWALAVWFPELPPARHLDEGAPGGMVAPDDFNPFAWIAAEPGPQTYRGSWIPWPEPELGLPPPPSRANILSALEVEHTGVPMRPGDVIRSTATLAGYEEREGRLGLMLLTTMEERWVNQRDEHLRTSRSTLVRYR